MSFNCRLYFVVSRTASFVPTRDVLPLHLMRCSYQPSGSSEDPNRKGWELEDETIAIK